MPIPPGIKPQWGPLVIPKLINDKLAGHGLKFKHLSPDPRAVSWNFHSPETVMLESSTVCPCSTGRGSFPNHLAQVKYYLRPVPFHRDFKAKAPFLLRRTNDIPLNFCSPFLFVPFSKISSENSLNPFVKLPRKHEVIWPKGLNRWQNRSKQLSVPS